MVLAFGIFANDVSVYFLFVVVYASIRYLAFMAFVLYIIRRNTLFLVSARKVFNEALSFH